MTYVESVDHTGIHTLNRGQFVKVKFTLEWCCAFDTDVKCLYNLLNVRGHAETQKPRARKRRGIGRVALFSFFAPRGFSLEEVQR